MGKEERVNDVRTREKVRDSLAQMFAVALLLTPVLQAGDSPLAMA